MILSSEADRSNRIGGDSSIYRYIESFVGKKKVLFGRKRAFLSFQLSLHNITLFAIIIIAIVIINLSQRLH